MLNVTQEAQAGEDESRGWSKDPHIAFIQEHVAGYFYGIICEAKAVREIGLKIKHALAHDDPGSLNLAEIAARLSEASSRIEAELRKIAPFTI